MRTARLLTAASVLTFLLCGSIALAQSVPATAVPFISQVTPPSLPPGTNPSIPSTFTLTILGANFTPNDTVNLAPSPSYVLHPATITVNPSGSQITAQFTNTQLGSPSTLAVTVSNPAGTPPSTSNTYYLPFTPRSPQLSSIRTPIPSSPALQKPSSLPISSGTALPVSRSSRRIPIRFPSTPPTSAARSLSVLRIPRAINLGALSPLPFWAQICLTSPLPIPWIIPFRSSSPTAAELIA